jgi:NADH:ubiquinone oxidoreductase subunit 2 (subunit N)
MVSLMMVSMFDVFLSLIMLEVLSLVILALIFYNLSDTSLEASTKYFLYNTVVSGISIFGIFALFFITKTTRFGVLYFIYTHCVTS